MRSVYPSGKICLSIINEEAGWKPSITIRQVSTYRTEAAFKRVIHSRRHGTKMPSDRPCFCLCFYSIGAYVS